MGLFSAKSSGGVDRKRSKPSINDSQSSITSISSSLKSPTYPAMTSTPFSPTASAPVHIPKVPLPRAPDPRVDPAAYLRSIGAVRERCHLILEKAKRDELNHFNVDMSKFEDTVKFVVSIIKRDFAPDYSAIPPHGRWQHFNVGDKDRITSLLQSWSNSTVDSVEKTRRLIDLFLVSVLLDAGAGSLWSYKSKENGKTYRRSEGLAVASLEMFKAGMFSSNENQPYRVDTDGLKKVTVESLARALQVSDNNPMTGLEGRASLLMRLSGTLKSNTEFFGSDARPGNMLDYFLSHPSTQASSVPIVSLPTLWHVLVDGLASVWPPSRTTICSTSLGDAWPLSTMPANSIPGSAPWEVIVPFHKLTQWLCYSLMQPMSAVMHIHFAGAELMTGLPEYRNGGLFIDTGVLTLKDNDMARGLARFKTETEKSYGGGVEVVPMFDAGDDVIVEWRAVTVGFLDELLEGVNEMLGLSQGDKLSLAQMLEAGSWKGGREIAEVSRPNTKQPPIAILSDGTVF